MSCFVTADLSLSVGMCPKGDDPFTAQVDYKTITFTTGASSGLLDGEFKLTFNGEYFYFDADANSFSASACEEAFEGLKNIKDVTCSRGNIDANNGATYTVEIVAFPLWPFENNIYTHYGDPPISSFQCDTDRVTAGTSPSCALVDVAVGTIPGE